MTRLYHTNPINPFYILTPEGKKGYTYLSDIKLYDPEKQEVVVSTGRGWFDNSNNYTDSIDIPDVVTRRKEKFDGKTFVMVTKDTFGDRSFILYVPISYFDFEITENVEINHGGGYTASLYRKYQSRQNPQIRIFKHVGTKTYPALREEAISLVKQIKELQSRLDEIDPYGQAKREVEEGLS